MSLEHEHQALRKLLAEDPAPRPDADFSARLREQFVRGQIPVRVLRQRHLAPQLWLLPLAAAALLLLWITAPQREATHWQLRAQRGVTEVLVDGQRVPLERLDGLLGPGRVLALPPNALGSVELSFGSKLYLELEHGVRVRIPAREGTRLVSEVGGNGQLRVVTGPDFAGEEWWISTSRAQWKVTGTAFTAMVHGATLCLCVMEGNVEACERGRPMEQVPAGSRFTLSAEASEAEHGAIVPGELQALSSLERRAQDCWMRLSSR